MGVFKDFKNIMRPYDDDEDDFQPFDYDNEEEEYHYQPKQRQEPARPKTRPAPQKVYQAPAPSPFDEPVQPREPAPVRETARPVRTPPAPKPSSQLKVVIVAPTVYEDASQIADNLIDGRTVLLNLEATDRSIARRLLDFLGGVTYARNGNIKRVTANTYIITPDNVDLMSDLVDELENKGLYF
ncbi:MAG: cell division protein SepF [Oscillospiraceae bacterium]|nr:cell division protein SepF [Oscillospiraceae bacterium]